MSRERHEFDQQADLLLLTPAFILMEGVNGVSPDSLSLLLPSSGGLGHRYPPFYLVKQKRVEKESQAREMMDVDFR